MDDIELTKLFVKYAELKDAIELTAEQIKKAVLDKGESVAIAGVKATYYKPGYETPDYKTSGQSAPAEIIERFTTTTTSTKWAEVCKAAGIEVPKGQEKAARVVLG